MIAVGALSYSSANSRKTRRARFRTMRRSSFAFKSRDDVRNEWRWRRGTIYDLAQSLRRAQHDCFAARGRSQAMRSTRIQGRVGAIRQRLHSDKSLLALGAKVADDLQINLATDEQRRSKSRRMHDSRWRLDFAWRAFLFQFALWRKRKVALICPSNALRRISEIRKRIGNTFCDEINYVAVFDDCFSGF